MNNIESKIKELEEKLEQLKQKLNKPKVWKPTSNDKYYFISQFGIEYDVWEDFEVDEFKYSIGNCFKTEEECKFGVERLKVITELKRFAEEHNEPLDWNNGSQEKHHICYDIRGDRFIVDTHFRYKQNDIFFTTEDLCRQAIAKIGEERIKKYYLGVE